MHSRSASGSAADLPQACDVVVVGAGPAGSACAQALARSGFDVALVDQHDFPRDKVCGDGLIPDAHAALSRMGVLDEVMDSARCLSHVRCIGPRGTQVDVPGTLAVLPRHKLDDLLCCAAQRAGARFFSPWRFEAPLVEAERVAGVRLVRGSGAPSGQVWELRSRWVVLATGATPQALIAAGLCERRSPSGVALRAYVQHDELAARLDKLQVVWHSRLKGGYGWIFPGPKGLFNVGTGLMASHDTQADGRVRKRDVNLRAMLERFAEVHGPAGELLRHGRLLGEFKGAPLRCSLRGARWSRPGLLVAGEAAGSTYAFTGEGIGKALETGLLAAQAIGEPAEVRADAAGRDAQVRQQYERSLAALQPRFDLYESASHVNRRPWLADLVIWRARRSPRILRRMSGVLEETQNPGRLLSWRGITRLLLE